MKYLNQIATAFCVAALGLMTLTSCEGGDLYSIDSPEWLSSRADSIAAAKAASQGEEEEIEGMHEDVYTVGAPDFRPTMRIAVQPTTRSMVPSVTIISRLETRSGVTISTAALCRVT